MIVLPGHNCTSCGNSLGIEVESDHYYTCSSCGETNIFHESSSRKTEVTAKRKETFSPIIIGAKGTINEQTFTITGCVTLFLTTFVVDCFSVTWSNGSKGFLMESENDFSLLKPVDENEIGKYVSKSAVGKETELKTSVKGFCHLIEKIEYISTKGHGLLPAKSVSGSFLCAFFAPGKKSFYSFVTREHLSLLEGHFYNFEQLNLNQGRIIHDWHR